MRGKWIRSWLIALMGAVGALGAPNHPIQFNRDIRPILSEHCFTCHGPDDSKRQSKLRLDLEATAKGDLGGHFAVVPGEPGSSEMIRRVSSSDVARRMPPAWSGAVKLKDSEIDLLTRWIAQGASWQNHWSFIPPERPDPPQVSDRAWPKNPIDNFVMARLNLEGLKPSPEADKRTL